MRNGATENETESSAGNRPDDSGRGLAQLMIEFDVGVSTENQYPIKHIDTDFFIED